MIPRVLVVGLSQARDGFQAIFGDAAGCRFVDKDDEWGPLRVGERARLASEHDVLHYFWGQYDQTLDCYAEVMEMRHRLGDRKGEAETLNNLGNVYHATGRHELALDYFTDAIPIYEEMPGWKTDLTAATERRHLPAEATAYLELIEQQVGVPVSLASTGPGRNQFLHFNQT